MKLMAIMVAGAALAVAGHAAAETVCQRPAAPAPLNAAAPTLEQLQAAKGEAAGFIAASDAYQTCLIADLAAQKAAAQKAKAKLSPEAILANKEAIDANQADKVQVGTSFNAAVKAYKAAHPS